ncbi:Secreted repeat of unknown function [Catalinimonas alkaloidigena]|uniref:Lipoprotein with Yx(FWY)xxD motif n=1 Tax=Catalinimonas alkaloidigena TaxID=1075417 RepID=A0A1G9HWE6_9BACT|nr:hypothetical protein [Catalinimonas alkaloidigena]SDL17146.1 Secreted repeat of unknown function [Catalinimonas alkaloidigena]
MNSSLNYLKPLFRAALVLGMLASCEKEDLEDDRLKIQVVGTNVLADQNQQSLYFFAGDVTGESTCNGRCAEIWPPLLGEVYDLKLGAGLSKSDFATITREDGQKQLTYKGWPLYYFSPEGDGVLEAPAETLGDGRNGVFHVAKPDYTVLVGRQSVAEGEDPVVYLTDDRGVSLYHTTGDEEGISNCKGGCATVWPPFKAVENPVIPSSLKASDFTVVTREDDLGPQLAYQGSPLYFFSNDNKVRGSVLGQGGGPAKNFFVAATGN